MSCFPCFSPKKKKPDSDEDAGPSESRPPTDSADKGREEDIHFPEFEGIRKFTADEISYAFNAYSPTNFIAEGSSGKVYKGRLPSGENVAIKKLNKFRKEEVHGVTAFIKEVKTLSQINHPNILKVLGIYIEESEMLLVYEYMSRGSLAQCLCDEVQRRENLDWNKRVKIAVEVSRALVYLHETKDPQIIHCDLKPANILLDDDFNAKVGDFGIVEIAPARGVVFGTTTGAGSFGYSCPEYVGDGKLCDRADVFSFGVILLELLTGRPAKFPGERLLVVWARDFLDDPQRVIQMADPSLNGRFPVAQFRRLAELASECTAMTQLNRPSILYVAAVLEDVASQPYNVPEVVGVNPNT